MRSRIFLAVGVLGVLMVGAIPGAWAQGGTWEAKASLPAAAAGKGAVVNNTFYVFGGEFPHLGEVATLQAYDPLTDSWAFRTTEPTRRSEQAVGVVHDTIYVVGGWNGATNTLFAANQAYDPASDTWSTRAPMPTARRSAASTVANEILYAIGGHIPFGGNLNTVEAYDPATDTWAAKAPMPTGRNFLSAGAVNGIIYAVGGVDNSNQIVATVEAYDPATNTWTTRSPMPTPRAVLGVEVVNGTLYAVGGFGIVGGVGMFLSTVEAYHPSTDTWTTVSSMSTPRQQLGVGVIGGVLYVAGGTNTSGSVAALEAFAPETTRIPAPAGSLSALAYDGAFLYVGFASSPCEIFKLDPQSGAVLGTLPTPTCQPRGIVANEIGQLYVSSLGNFGAGDVLLIDQAGTVLHSFSVPFRAHAIAFDGASLYIGDTDSGQVRVTDRFGNHIRTFESGLRPAGMVYDHSSGHLWVITMFDSKIYEITTEGQMVRSCDGPRNPGVQGLGGLTMVGSNLYVGEADPDPFNPPTPDPPAVIYIVEPAALPCSPSFIPPACMPQPWNVVAWWAAEDDARDIQNANHGTLQGGTSFAGGQVARTFDLNGSSAYVRVPDHPSLDMADGFMTVAAWIFPRSFGGPHVIASKWDDPTAQWSWIFKLHNDGSGRLRFEISRGDHNALGDVGGVAILPLNSWTHVAATYDRISGRLRLYVNGDLDSQSSASVADGRISDSATDVLIGAVNGQTGPPIEFFDGLIDEMQLFNRPLSRQEIFAMFSTGSAGQCRPAIPPNQPPVANAGADQIVEATGASTAVTLDGSASSDPDAGQMLSYEWRDAGNIIVGTNATVAVSLPLGSHTFTLTVNDGNGGSASDTVMIIVQDTTAPSLMLAYSSYQQILPIGTSAISLDVLALSGASATDAVDPAPAITSNAPAQFAAGVTNVTLTATDDNGNFSQAAFTVTLLTPSQAIQQLSGMVQSFNLQQGLSNSLDSKLENAQEALDAANAGNRGDAANKLQAFINSVEAQRGNHITNAQADQLIAAAQAVLAAI